MTGYTMQKIFALHCKAISTLYDGWDDSAYNDLEEVRKMAEKKGHLFEELWILLDEVKYLINNHNDRDLFYAANLRLKELHSVFEMPDDEFKTIFEENYVNGKKPIIQKQTYECLLKLYDRFFRHADYMAAHLNYMPSLLCGKAMYKIEMLSGRIDLKNRIERMFKMAMDYGYIGELDKAMEYYNKAIKTAHEEEDYAYEYIALMRKLSICLTSEHITNHIDLDSETMSTVTRIGGLCDEYQLAPYALGEWLVETEKKKAKSGKKADISEAKWRIDRLREVMPMLPLQLALSRGDWQTAHFYADELKEKELEAYGSSSDYSNADMIIPAYAMLYNSPERNDAEEEILIVEQKELDKPCLMNFPEGTLTCVMYNNLIQEARKRMGQQQIAAESLCKQAEEIATNVYSDYHKAMAIHSIGQSYESVGNNAEALSYYRNVVGMLTEYAHPGSDVKLSKYMLYASLLGIGNLTKDTAPQESIHILTDAIRLVESKRNDEEFFLKNLLLLRAKAKTNIGDIQGGEKDCKDFLDLILNDANKRLPFIDKELRENYWAEVSKLLCQVVAQVNETSSPSFRLAVYNAILMTKGFLLSSEKAEREAVYSEDSLREYIPLYKELEKYEISKLPWGTMTENSADKYVEHYMKSMKLQMATNGVIEKYYDFMHIRFDSITNVLNENDVVLDYYDYPLEKGDQQYVAFIYKKGMEAPEFVKVCKESDLQRVYQEVAAKKYEDGSPFHISEVYNPTWMYSAQLCKLILNVVLKKIEFPLDSKIFFVPSGSLHKVPVESLIVEEGSEITVSDFYTNFARISHVRTLLIPDDWVLNSVGLFGGLNYGVERTDESHTRGYVIGLDDQTPTPLVPWGELKQTLTEVRNISFLCQMAKGMTAEIYTGLDGTPDKLRELSEKGCSVLHLATHGFFETIKSKVNIPGLKGAYKPMDLTGVVMSNGNEGWLHGNNMCHEGILTATDIAKMDLSQSKLVVLSACYTGEGVVRSDGVFGLQRAFKKAGAGSIVMSLWNESDEVGTLFMSVFYSHLFSENIDKNKAFKLAKTEIRKRFPHPLFWANFIMID